MFQNISKTIFLVYLFSLASSQTLVDECEGGVPLPTAVNVVGCLQQPCPFVKGTNAVFYMNFTASEPIEELKAEVIARALGVNVNYPLPQPNACRDIQNTHCPLEINEPVQYKFTIFIEEIFPPIPIKLTFYLLPNGETERRLICFAIRGRVV